MQNFYIPHQNLTEILSHGYMQNLELKVRINDIQPYAEIAEKLGAQFTWQHNQKDTYFLVPQGKLKLREQSGKNYSHAELIAYNRPSVASEKISNYLLYSTSQPEKLAHTLAHVLEISVVVEKIRTLFLWKNVRIHLDVVQHLGNFLEFEAVISNECDAETCQERIEFLKSSFHLQDEQLVACGYYELMTAKKINLVVK